MTKVPSCLATFFLANLTRNFFFYIFGDQFFPLTFRNSIFFQMFTNSLASDDNNQNLCNNHVQNQSENGRYNLILVYLSRYEKDFSVCAGEHLSSATPRIGLRRRGINPFMPTVAVQHLLSERLRLSS